MAENIEATPTRDGISFKYKGRNFASLYPRRKSFVLQWKESEYYPYETNLKKIERVRELFEEKIKDAFELVGGKLLLKKKRKPKTHR